MQKLNNVFFITITVLIPSHSRSVYFMNRAVQNGLKYGMCDIISAQFYHTRTRRQRDLPLKF